MSILMYFLEDGPSVFIHTDGEHTYYANVYSHVDINVNVTPGKGTEEDPPVVFTASVVVPWTPQPPVVAPVPEPSAFGIMCIIGASLLAGRIWRAVQR